MFLSVVLTGCEELDNLFGDTEPEPDYITVTVKAQVEVIYQQKDPKNNITASYAAEAVTIRIEIVKAGGENAVFLRTSDSMGGTGTVDATFKVYKEQPIEVVATPQGPNILYVSKGYRFFGWEEMWAAASKKFGGSCTLLAYGLKVVIKTPIKTD